MKIQTVALALAFGGLCVSSGASGGDSLSKQTPEPYVQITSVSVEPSAIHVKADPLDATVIVQMILRGNAPKDAKVRVEVGSYSSDPPGISVRYSEPQTIAPKEPLTTLKFSVASEPATVQGKLKIAATIYGPGTKGVNIQLPPSPSDWVAQMNVVDP